MGYLGQVLLAGGDAATLSLRESALRSAGYDVTTADATNLIARARDSRASVAVLSKAIDATDPFGLIDALRSDAGAAALPLMLLDSDGETDRDRAVAAGVDDLIERGADDAMLPARLRPLFRLSTMHHQMLDRLATAATFGVSVAPPGGVLDLDNCRVLVATGDPRTAAELQSVLAIGMSVDLETDPYVAGDRLANERYDAVIVAHGPNEDAEAGIYLCGHIRRNPQLYNLPVLLLTHDRYFARPADAYRTGASVVQWQPTDPLAVASIIQVLVRRQRRAWLLRDTMAATLTPSTADTLNGVYSAAFLHAHLDRMLSHDPEAERPLSLAAFTIANATSVRVRFGIEAHDVLLQQMADWITGLVRIEDVCGWLGENRFAVILPDTPADEAQEVVQRIVAVLSHVEFHLTEEICQAVGAWVESGQATQQPGEAAEDLIAGALANAL